MFTPYKLPVLSWVCWSALVPWIYAQQEPSVKQIADAGRQTVERFAREGASWTTVFELKNGLEAKAEVTEAPTMRHTRISLGRAGQSEELVRITERENVWYVEDPSGRFKYRPYEAPWMIPAASMFLSRSNLRVVSDEQQPLGKFTKLDGDVATFSGEIPGPLKEQLESTLANLLKLEQENPSKKSAMQGAKQQIQQLLESGITSRVNVKSGVVEQTGTIGQQVWIKNFKWLAKPDSDVFRTDNQEWTDRSSSLVESAQSLDDLIMISNAPTWRPGQPGRDSDLLLMNIKTNETRRVPYALGVVANACFSKDRKSVYVAGHVPDEGGIGIFEVNLLTAEHRRLGTVELLSGAVMFPALSPNGKYLVVLKVDQRAGPLKTQVFVIDIQSGADKPIGKPLDTTQPCWLPGGAGFILVSREYEDLNKPAIETICRMDFSGNITPIRKGGSPLVLHPQSLILYRDPNGMNYRSYCPVKCGERFSRK